MVIWGDLDMKKNRQNRSKRKRVLFYSSVKDKSVFNIQRFYEIDIEILKELGYDVILSNSIVDAWIFWKYDFVFAYFYRYAFFVSLIAKLFGNNTYFTGGIDALDQNLVSHKTYLIQKYLFMGCYYISKSCIIVSKTDDANVRQLVKGAKLSFSEHSIDTSRFDCNISSKEDLCCSIVWQANSGNIKRKGVDCALRIFAKLLQLPQFQNYKFIVIGKKGEGTSYLENIVKELRIENAVEFTDSVSEEEKIAYLKRSRFYFQLSKFEGFGVAALEALCAKNIVIHSGKGGLSNPIYAKGILVNIDQSVEMMFEELKETLVTFNGNHLEEAHKSVCQNYDNKRRKEDFARIIQG